MKPSKPSKAGAKRLPAVSALEALHAYCGQPILSTLLRELPWPSNLRILNRSKQPEEREFYLRMATQQRWSVREGARQIDASLFERAALNRPKVSAALRQLHTEHQGSLSRHLSRRIADARGAATMSSSKPSCRHDEKVSPLVRQIPGSKNLLSDTSAWRSHGEVYDRLQ